VHRIATLHWQLLVFLKTLSGVVIFGVFVAIVVDVFMRIAGMQPWLYFSILVEYGLLWFAMLAAPWLARIKGHVFIDAITQLLPAAGRRVIAKLSYLICIVSSAVFAYYSLQLLIDALANSEIDTRAVDVPMWALLAPIPLSFFLVAIEFVRFLFGFDSMYGERTEVRDNV
jgi:TRAP-type C4-dicarboxylate transport system permease small subunit